MAVKEEFEIVIDKEGALKAIAKGFAGRECEIPLKRLIEMLGVDTSIQFGDEYRRASECTDVETKVKDK
jgi:hypothetical protein